MPKCDPQTTMTNAELAESIKAANEARAKTCFSTAVMFERHVQRLLDEQHRRATNKQVQDG